MILAKTILDFNFSSSLLAQPQKTKFELCLEVLKLKSLPLEANIVLFICASTARFILHTVYHDIGL